MSFLPPACQGASGKRAKALGRREEIWLLLCRAAPRRSPLGHTFKRVSNKDWARAPIPQNGRPNSGAHECVAISIANSASLYFATDPTTATAVIDPTVAHPAGSGHFGSAWRNTNSIVMPAGGAWIIPFHANIEGNEAVRTTLAVTASKVPAGWDRAGEPAQLRKTLERTGAVLRLPLFLLPDLRAHLPAAHDDLKIQIRGDRDEAASLRKLEHDLTVHPGRGTRFTVSGAIPRDARPGDIFLINVAAHYPPTKRAREAVVEYLEVIYVKS